MAGIYLHIPFCKKRCIYCNFYSSTLLKYRGAYVGVLCRELRQRKEYLKGEAVKTIYLGGGTPSLLQRTELEKLFSEIGKVYGLGTCEEITIEANPDDLTEHYVKMLATLPVNRLSIGIQTFNDDSLKLLNRRHTAEEAISAVKRCQDAGFHNISIDLIYGLPGETEVQWQYDLEQAVALGVQHISAYSLTYEEGTALWKLREKQQIQEVEEEQSLLFFKMLMDTLKSAGFEHYEISNFCLPGYHSRHNSSYWEDIPYLGCGASAHSYDGISRQWNVADLERYIQGIAEGTPVFEREILDLPTRYNEFVMTGLRTAKGIELTKLRQQFGEKLFRYLLEMAKPYIDRNCLLITENRLHFTESGLFISDSIISDLLSISD
ncbi:MAG: radical SAM family heme chaperone HemW [Bacteroidaceae bacterium]|nr:radical SAM family heme chaperone HemW [Bacteroidaceae bacterium]